MLPQQQPPKNMKCTIHGNQLKKVKLVAPINFREVQDVAKSHGVHLRGAGPDEAPAAYRRLSDVLEAHKDTIEILHMLKPRIVVMADERDHDPYKD